MTQPSYSLGLYIAMALVKCLDRGQRACMMIAGRVNIANDVVHVADDLRQQLDHGRPERRAVIVDIESDKTDGRQIFPPDERRQVVPPVRCLADRQQPLNFDRRRGAFDSIAAALAIRPPCQGELAHRRSALGDFKRSSSQQPRSIGSVALTLLR
ncbi:MAG TPA: hypothetical protein VFL55_13445 [Acetobacteraceae bacterium]|nr:hypothetical protein [Acetobacteraceae bacterium]